MFFIVKKKWIFVPYDDIKMGLFGRPEEPHMDADHMLYMIGAQPEFGRFRGAYVTKSSHRRIFVRTRNSGICDCDYAIESMELHPLFVRGWNDDFSPSYYIAEYKILPKFKEEYDKILLSAFDGESTD